jgi:hypothetical protein
MRAETDLDAGRQLLRCFWLASASNDAAHHAAGVLQSVVLGAEAMLAA